MVLKRTTDDPPGINLTPLIDIVFLLIIFFMVGTRFSELNDSERDIDLQVPQVADAGPATAAPSRKVINVFADGRITLDGETLSLAALQTQLQNAADEYGDLGVIVRGEDNAEYQKVADVLAACRQAKIRELGISVRVARKE